MVVRPVICVLAVAVAVGWSSYAEEAEQGDEALLAEATQLAKQLLQHSERGEYR